MLHAVRQKHGSGCFVAAIATLIGKSYYDTYKILHPGKDPMFELEHGFRDTCMIRAAMTAMERAGLKGILAPYKRFSSYIKRDKHALMIIRWKCDPEMCHAIVYDGEAHKFLDPLSGGEVDERRLKRLQRQLEAAIFVEKVSQG